MRPVGVVILGFAYLMSMGYYVAEQVYLIPLGIDGQNLDGVDIDAARFTSDSSAPFEAASERHASRGGAGGTDTFDQVLGFSFDGFQAVWTILGLMTGSYFLQVLGLVGVPPALEYVLTLIMAFISVRTLIYFILGR